MKIVPATTKSLQQVPAPIPLMRCKRSEDAEANHQLQIELKSNPSQTSSQKYKQSVSIFRIGTIEEFLEWKKDLESVFEGQAIKTAPAKFAMTKRLLGGDPLINFENAIALHGEETDDHFVACLNDLVLYIFPRRALRIQKRYMRRQMRKPRDMRVRDFVARVQELNNYLTQFPPFATNQSLPEDEILDILESAVPNAWQREFVRSGFDPIEHDIREFVERCERVELTETLEIKNKETKSSNNNKNKGNSLGTRSTPHRSGGNNNKGSKWSAKSSEEAPTCPLHGKGHSMDNCKVLRAQAEKMKAMFMAKSYEQKADERKKKRKIAEISKNEINAMIEAKLKKSKKASKHSASSSDISDEEDQQNDSE